MGWNALELWYSVTLLLAFPDKQRAVFGKANSLPFIDPNYELNLNYSIPWIDDKYREIEINKSICLKINIKYLLICKYLLIFASLEQGTKNGNNTKV